MARHPKDSRQELIELIKKFHLINPDMRLAQTLYAAQTVLAYAAQRTAKRHYEYGTNDIFYLDDDTVIVGLKLLLKGR